jgi:signal transduction histidine kinase
MRSQLEFKGVRKDGTIVWLDNRMSLINWYGKIAVLSAVFDVTEQKLAHDRVVESKDQAVASSRAKSEFLANMSHELRTPLNAIIGFSEVLRDELFGPLGQDRYKDYATDIHSSGVHLLSVINDILDVAKAEAGKLELSEEVVRVEDVVSGVLRLIRERASNNDISLIVTVPDNMPDLRCDPLKLKQVLINLLSNAVKFTLPHGDVILSAGTTDNGDFFFEIKDTGIGMAKESIPLAMEAFAQVDSSLDRKYEGTGLGLPLVKMLTDLHGGHFELDSELGVGTTARIRLPAYRVMANGSSSPYATNHPEQPGRIHDVA